MTPAKKSSLGPTGETVRYNVRRLREAHHLTYAELSRRLEHLGRPIATLGLSRIENGERRVDTDDLMALSIALGVSPATLLVPLTSDAKSVEATGLPTLTPAELWRFIEGYWSPYSPGLKFVMHARPTLARNVRFADSVSVDDLAVERRILIESDGTVQERNTIGLASAFTDWDDDGDD